MPDPIPIDESQPIGAPYQPQWDSDVVPAPQTPVEPPAPLSPLQQERARFTSHPALTSPPSATVLTADNPHADQPIPIAAAQPEAPGMGTTFETQTSSTPGVTLPRELKDKQALSFEDEQEALQTQRKVAEQKAAYQDAFMQQRNQDLAREAHDAEVRRLDIQVKTDQQIAKIKSLQQDFQQNSHIDQAKYFKDIGPAGSIATVLGAAIGTIGAALSKSENVAVRFIENQISRSIAAQEKEIEVKRENINLANNLVGLYRQQGLDANQAHLAAKASIMDHFQSQLESLAARYADTEIGAKYQEAAAALQQKRNQTEQQQFFMEHAKATTQTTMKTAPTAVNHEAEKELRGRMVTLPAGMKAPNGGTEIPAKTEKQAQDMGELLDERSRMLGDLESIEEHLTPGHSIAGKNKIILEQAFNRIKEGFHNLEGKGIRFTEQDQKMFEQIADPTSMWTRDSTVRETISEARKTLNRAIASKGRQTFGEASPFGE